MRMKAIVILLELMLGGIAISALWAAPLGLGWWRVPCVVAVATLISLIVWDVAVG